MFNLLPACELPVGNLFVSTGTSCSRLSTLVYSQQQPSTNTSGYPRLIRILSEFFPTYYTQSKPLLFHLLNTQVLHISTALITTNIKKGLKK